MTEISTQSLKPEFSSFLLISIRTWSPNLLVLTHFPSPPPAPVVPPSSAWKLLLSFKSQLIILPSHEILPSPELLAPRRK